MALGSGAALGSGVNGLALLLLTVGIALGISFLCSLLEATLLSTRLPELSARRDRGDRGAALLLELKQQRIDDAISAILTLNTIAHTIGAALAGAQAAVLFGDRWVGVFSGVLTFLVLVLTEIIPKTVGTVYASHLVGFVGATIRWMIRLMRPILGFTRLLTRAIARHPPSGVSRSEVAALVTLAGKQGALHEHELRMLSRVLRYEGITVQDVMTPRTVTVMVPAEATVGELVAVKDYAAFSRVPLFEGSKDNIVGYILQREVLWFAAQGGDQETRLSTFARKLRYVPQTESLSRVLRELIANREHMAVAGDEFGGAAGIVTLEDLVETILDVEIVDESDQVVDLRTVAKELRDKRLARVLP